MAIDFAGKGNKETLVEPMMKTVALEPQLSKQTKTMYYTVDGRNMANQLIGNLSQYLQGFVTCQVVQDFFHQLYCVTPQRKPK